MFIIRKEQVLELDRQMMEKFVRMAVLHLRKMFPVLLAGEQDEPIVARVRSGVTKAEKYGVTEIPDVLYYLECMVRYGDDFDIHPPVPVIARTLRTRNFSGTQKMDKIKKLQQA